MQPHKDSAANQKKTKIVEVIDFGGDDTNTAPVNNQFFSEDDQEIQSDSNEVKTRLRLQRNDSDMMLKKLMENIRSNNGLKNKHIRKMFKLDLIREESDLHQYKNLLNAMAALFYTNHQMSDIGSAFEKWRQVFANLKKQKRPKIPIIDTDLANKQYKASQKQEDVP